MAEVLPSEELIEEPSDFGALQPGMRLGRYELLVPIARGGMARVWAARLHGQRGFQKLVAIKVILPHLAEEPEFERMFLDEARIASGVHHPNVCEIYELGEEKRTLYLVMEWVNGDSFARILRASGKTEAIDPRVVARVIADACAGVHAAHEQLDDEGQPLGVVHRDLSPHNILVSSDGTAKVCDFGVAKALGQLHEATSAGQLKGKISYMAPEQITGTTVDRRSDVFSLGCVLYEATTGARPFRGDGDHQVMHAVLKGEITPPTSIIRGYPPELERIVLRALAKAPLLRFPTAERMRFALEELLARGQLVTQANVAQVVRARIGTSIDRRRERIRQASGDPQTTRDGGFRESPMTPSQQPPNDHRSGVKPSGSAAAAKPLFATLQMDRPEASAALAKLVADSGPPPPVSARPRTAQMSAPPSAPPQTMLMPSQVPSQNPFTPAPTPGSHPGASHSSSGIPARSAPPPFAQTVPLGAVSPFHTQPPVGGPFGGGPSSNPPVPSYADSFGPEPAPASPPPAGQYAIAIAVGLLVAVMIGTGGFFAWRRGHTAPTGEVATPTNQTAPAPAGSVTPVSIDVALVVVPAEATLTADGKPLATRSLPRPTDGRTVNVVVHANGYEDTTVLVDVNIASPVAVTLRPAAPSVAESTPSALPPAADEPTTAAPAAREPGKKRKEPKEPKDPALPSNPY